MIKRLTAAASFGTVITFGLLFMMQLLIATGEGAVTNETRFAMVDFVRVERNEIIETKKEKPEKPPEPEQQPDLPSPEQLDNFDNAMAVSVTAPQLTNTMRMGGVGFAISDGEYLPIVKVAPVYPARALSRGLEGYVIVEFTVTRSGTVRDVFVIESTSQLFERAASEAALKFKYKPRVIDGEPVEVPGVRNKISFAIAV